MRGEAKSVITSASIVVSGAPIPQGEQSAVVKAPPTNTAAVWLGGSNVDTGTNGFPLAAGDSVNIDITNESLWAVSPSGTQTLYILRRGE